MNPFEESFKSYNTLKNIRKTLKKRLKEAYGLEGSKLNKIATEILEVHGMNTSNFDVVTLAGNGILSQLNMNDDSIDPNANKALKTISRLMMEINNSLNKIVGYDFLYRKIKELNGQEEAVRLCGLLYDYTLSIHDSTKLLVPYCYAYNGSNLIEFGRSYGEVECMPAKHLHSYISMLCGTIHTISSNLAGAIAVGTFFIDSCNVLLREGITIDRIKKYSLNPIKILRDILSRQSDRKYVENMFQQFIYDVRDLTRNGCECPFTNLSIFDRTKLSHLLDDKWKLFKGIKVRRWYGRKTQVTKSEVIDYILKLQELYMDIFDNGDPSKNGMQFNFPVTTINFGKDSKLKKITDQKFLYDTCKHKINRYNIFVSEGSKVASCCRLLSDTEFLDLASQSNSFGGGASADLGSHRVVTIDLPRIAMMSSNMNDFNEKIKPLIQDTVKILKAHLELLKDLTDKGLEPVVSTGLVNLNRMFSTLGLIGIYEAAEIMRNKLVNKDIDIIKDMLVFINKEYVEAGLAAGLKPNIEQIPGESVAVRLAKVDKLLFPEMNYEMYSNQTLPLWINASLYERLEEDGKCNLLYTGGGIIHAPIDELPTPEQSVKIINKAVECGAEHFALNLVTTECPECGHVEDTKLTECPKCKNKNLDYWTRVVGFLSKVRNWNPVRREWEFPKRKSVNLKEIQ